MIFYAGNFFIFINNECSLSSLLSYNRAQFVQDTNIFKNVEVSQHYHFSTIH